MRVILDRLHIACGLDGHEFYLECHPPSARLTASKMFCRSLPAEGLQELASAVCDGSKPLGQVKQAFGVYSRFRPQHHEVQLGNMQWRVPGDIPGSRTHPSSNPAPPVPGPKDVVSQLVTVDAHDLFSQLSTLAFLGKRGPHGLLASIQEVSQGHIRVWRQWLSKQCETKKWSDGESIAVYHDAPIATTTSKARSDSVTGCIDTRHDPKVLWLNTRDENVGIKFKVRERRWRRNAPVLFSSEEEVPVSYIVEFEGTS
jgi:hypothetical protein